MRSRLSRTSKFEHVIHNIFVIPIFIRNNFFPFILNTRFCGTY